MTLAMRGKAVSPVTSYLAIEPGVRPSTEGLEEAGGGGFGLGLGGVGEGGFGRGSGSGVVVFDRMAFLRQRLRQGWERCGGEKRAARVSLETTRAEIVAVVATIENSTPPLERCLKDAAWGVMLPDEFHEEWKQWSFDI